MPSQGILHVLPLNVSPEKAQRLGVVPAFWELGVVALHGTEAPRAQGGRMQETTGPGVPLRGKGGAQNLPGSVWGSFSTQVGHIAASPGGRRWPFPNTLCVCEMSVFERQRGSWPLDSILCNFLKGLCSIGKQAPSPSIDIKIQIETNTPNSS